MIAFSSFPSGITLCIFARDPSPSGSVHEVLSTKYIHRKKQLWVLDTAVHMTLCRKVYNKVYIVFSKQLVCQILVSDVAFHEETTFVVNIVLDSTQITCVGQRIQYNHLDVFVLVIFVKQLIDEVGSDEACGSCN